MKFDVLLKGGLVADGEGNALSRADVAIKGDKIAAIGDLPSRDARQTRDVTGLVVAPGFIDVHNHAHSEVGGGIMTIPHADNMLRQGVTTLIAGNCGGSPFPMGEHLDGVDKLDIRQNYACLVGHGTVRRETLKTTQAQATSAGDLDTIRCLVRDAIDEGAIGVSAGYFPEGVTTDELVAAAQGAAERGGTYASHIRSEGDALLEAVEEIIQIGERANVPVQISHFKTFGPANWDKCQNAIRLVDGAHDRGVRVLADRYPYVASYGGIASIVPSWARRKEGLAGLSEEERQTMRDAVDNELNKMGGPDSVIVAPWETDEEIGGKTLAQLATAWKQHPGDVAVTLAARGRISAIRFAMCEENLCAFLAHPLVFVASDGHLRKFGDGTSHPRNYGTFPRVLAEYVREQKLIPLEDAIRKMTSMPAKQFHLKDRGVIREGAIADIVVFDPETVRDTATFADPHQYPEGIPYIFVNGGLAVSEGKTTHLCYGRVIRGPRGT